ncbi:MAG: DoxX family protein [Ferruginibacter sp.]
MKKLLSIKYSAGAFNAAMLILRLGLGIMMMHAGYQKLINFDKILHTPPGFINFLGIGTTMSLALVVFAEFFCSLFLILGLFTRLAAIPLIITMCVALFKAHNAEIFGQGQTAALYLTGYLVLLFVGPGRVSVDSMIAK